MSETGKSAGNYPPESSASQSERIIGQDIFATKGPSETAGGRADRGAGSGSGRREELRPWTEEEREALRVLHAQHLANTEIACRLGRTSEAVSNMSRRLGLRRRDTAQPWTGGQLRLLQRMLEDGCSLKQIADTTGHPRSSVADKLRRLNIQSLRFRRPWTDGERDTVLALHAAGASLTAIAQAVPNRSADAVQQKLQELVGPAPFRSAQRTRMAVAVKAKAERPAESPPAAPVFRSAAASVPSPARTAVRLIRERREIKPTVVMASVDEMVRWLRSRDFMVLYRVPGWQVDRHVLEDEVSLLEFVNIRRHRLNLPPFITSGCAAQSRAVEAMAATG